MVVCQSVQCSFAALDESVFDVITSYQCIILSCQLCSYGNDFMREGSFIRIAEHKNYFVHVRLQCSCSCSFICKVHGGLMQCFHRCVCNAHLCTCICNGHDIYQCVIYHYLCSFIIMCWFCVQGYCLHTKDYLI